MLPTDETDALGVHIDKECETCGRQFKLLREVSWLTHNWMLKEPPIWLMNRGLALFERRRVESGRRDLKKIWGVLIADHPGGEMLLGFRHVASLSRQVLYRAGDYDVDLSVHYGETRGSVVMTGQANPVAGDFAAVAGCEVELLTHHEVMGTTLTNEFGWFFLEDIPEGIYDLRIRLETIEILIAGLEALAPVI